MSLTTREQELVILRVGVLSGSNYVWMHHVPVGREFGITEDELHAIRTVRYRRFPPREQALLALTDELVEARTIRRPAWDTHRAHLRDVEIVDLVNLVGQYVFLALINSALQIAVEKGIAGTPAIDDVIASHTFE